MILIVAILVFLAVAALAVAIFQNRQGADARRLDERLRSVGGGRADVVTSADASRDQRYSSVAWFDALLRRINLGESLELLLYQAGMTMRPGMLILLIVGFGIGGYALGVLSFQRVLPGLVFMVAFAFMPYFYVVYKKHARMKAFAREFPDALDLLVSALRAGLAFSAAMQIVAEESPDPVRTEFAITVEEQSLGIDFREALTNLTKRVDSLDLRFFVTAVLLQRDTGGNLAEILQNTANIIRDRFRILGDIATFTAQGRMTGAILGALPMVMAVFMVASAPEYFKPMLENEKGRQALIFAGVLQLLGGLAIKKIVSIRV
jgi:tight adherence protein B